MISLLLIINEKIIEFQTLLEGLYPNHSCLDFYCFQMQSLNAVFQSECNTNFQETDNTLSVNTKFFCTCMVPYNLNSYANVSV